MGDPDDSQDYFFRDMVVEGRYLNDQSLVQAHVEDVPDRVHELLEWGLKVTEVRQMPGHSYPRNMYTSGLEMVKTLSRQVKKRPIKVLEDTLVTDLITQGGQVIGAVAVDLDRGEVIALAAKATVLATGGGHNLYPFTTGPEDLTGDGQAMAYRAGARLINLEMMQFIPTTIIDPPLARGNLFPFLVGPQNALRVWLLNKYGERFMGKWDPVRMEHSTRDLLSIGITSEILEGRGSPRGGVYFSLAHLPRNLIADFARWGAKPFLRSDWTAHGINFRPLMERVMDGDAIEVAPAAHFFMGGVKVEADGATTLPGLFAAGEATGGVHGANRLSGNAFAQIVVQGKRAGEAAVRFARSFSGHPDPSPRQLERLCERPLSPLKRDLGVVAYELRRELHGVAAEKLGVLRDGKVLGEVVSDLSSLRGGQLPRLSSRSKERRYNPEWIECLQVENILTVLEMIARSALAREESRGAHFRRDFPETDNRRWLRNTIVERRNEEMAVGSEPVRITLLQPPSEK
jgi:succinate dehydrogenase/fumarate reductase flavoprotein subunit